MGTSASQPAGQAIGRTLAGRLQLAAAMQIRALCCASLGMLFAAASVGCGGAQVRRDFLGRGGAVVGTDPNPDGSRLAVVLGAPGSNAPGAGGIAVRAGDRLEVAWTIAQPRAERVRFAIACPGAGDEVIEAG